MSKKLGQAAGSRVTGSELEAVEKAAHLYKQCGLLREENERLRARVAEPKRVYVVVGEDTVPSRDAHTTTTWVIAVCSTEDEALRRIIKAPRAPGSRYVCSVQVWEVDGTRVR